MTYRSVAEEAGVAHGLVRHHFGSIDLLIEEALQVCIAKTATGIGLAPGVNSLDNFARGIIDSLQSDSDTQLFQYEILLESRRTESFRESVDIMMTHYKSVVREGLRRIGLSVDRELVEFVYATLEGIVLQQSVRGLTKEADEAINVLHQVLSLLKVEQEAERVREHQ